MADRPDGIWLSADSKESTGLPIIDGRYYRGTAATRVSGGYFYANMVGQNFRITSGADNNQMIRITAVGPGRVYGNNCTTATLANAPGHGDQAGFRHGDATRACPNCKVTDVTARFNEFRNLTGACRSRRSPPMRNGEFRNVERVHP